MNTKYLRKYELDDMTQKEFAETFHIPYATVRNWDARDCMPEYVLDLLRYRVNMEQLLDTLEKSHPNDEAVIVAAAHSKALAEM